VSTGLINPCPFTIHIYSQTSLYRTRIIRTSGYIEVALWSRPPAIVTGGKRHWIYRTRLYRILGYIEYAAPPHTSTASFISKSINTSDSGRPVAGRGSAGEMRHHTPPTVSSHRPPTVTGADTLQAVTKKLMSSSLSSFPLNKQDELSGVLTATINSQRWPSIPS